MTEWIDIEVDDVELDEVIARIDEAILKKVELVTGTTRVEGLEIDLIGVENMAAAIEASVQETVDRLTLEILAVKPKIDMIKAEALSLDLPQIDRATRMILLRIPGLRQALQLMYVIKMMERTLRLGDLRGPVTAAITAGLYAAMALQALEQRQAKIEARMADLERTTAQRFITMEEALRGYERRPEKYRATVAP